MDVPEVRRRLRTAIDHARRQAVARRERADTASRDYERFLGDRAIPVFRIVAASLAAEGYRFEVFTPAGSVRLSAGRSNEDFIELTLDTSSDKPVLVVRTSRGRGRRQVTSERAVLDASKLSDLTDEDVLGILLAEIEPFVER